MAASLTYPAKKVMAVVGDGGFLDRSYGNRKTAVRLKLNITVIVFRDGGYNMVAFQQELDRWAYFRHGVRKSGPREVRGKFRMRGYAGQPTG